MSELRPDLDRLIEFHKFLLNFRNIERVVHLEHAGKIIKENDVEHSYFLAMMAWYLASFFPKLDRDLLIRTALVHDLVEVYAGDTYIYADEAVLSTKQKREKEAAEKIVNEWPDFPQMNKLIEDYEVKKTDEAKFIYALDKIMPIILNLISGGVTWKTMDISLEKLHKNKKDKVAVSKEVNDYYEEIYKILESSSHLFPAK